jgi:predicted Zn-dependent protease
MDSIASFHRLSPEEIARVKPLRLHIVTAGANDSTSSISAGMTALGLPPDSFVILNGLDKAAQIEPGSQYKIVGE